MAAWTRLQDSDTDVFLSRYDGTQWHAMVDPGWSETTSLASFNGELYAHGFWGGSFIPRRFLKWDAVGSQWLTVATFDNVGYLGIVQDMVVFQNKLVITGDVGINGHNFLFTYDGTNFDGVGNGLGYSLILITVAIVRELFGTGSLLEVEIFRLAVDGGWYEPNAMLLLPPSAFFIIGFIIWGIRSWKPTQVEQPDYKPIPLEETTG